MVTANLPPFAAQGSRIDVNVSALGDSDSLQGGTLLVTPLLGADGEIYAIAQGPVSINGFKAEGDAASVVSGVPTTGRISSGALVEREIGFDLASLQDPAPVAAQSRSDDCPARRARYQRFCRRAHGRGREPFDRTDNRAGQFQRQHRRHAHRHRAAGGPDRQPAKIVIDENSGIIVMGRDVRVSTVAVAQSNLTVTIAESPQVSQPNALANGQTTEVPRSDVQVTTSGSNLATLPESVTLQQLVDGLNALGISPRDLIGILQAIKAAGALQAEIEVM